MQVTDKVFVATGAGNGIGREVVLGLLTRGAKVAAVDLNAAALAETAALALPDQVTAAHGQVDGLVNVAGIIQPFVKIVELGFDDIERVLIGGDATFMDRFARFSPRRATLLIADQMKSLLG
jgi:NAD(P)-dependent dehydrogenase (short-subunit alcohol dehydrogenase family)